LRRKRFMNGNESSRPTLAASRSATEGVATSRPAVDGAALSADQILDGLAEGFFALDSNWRFIAFNRAAEEIFETPREQVLGKRSGRFRPEWSGRSSTAAIDR
jgi:PAS domain-containing protein